MPIRRARQASAKRSRKFNAFLGRTNLAVRSPWYRTRLTSRSPQELKREHVRFCCDQAIEIGINEPLAI